MTRIVLATIAIFLTTGVAGPALADTPPAGAACYGICLGPGQHHGGAPDRGGRGVARATFAT